MPNTADSATWPGAFSERRPDTLRDLRSSTTRAIALAYTLGTTGWASPPPTPAPRKVVRALLLDLCLVALVIWMWRLL